ncbi:MAG: metallophosphoesterase family protein [Candidatus Brocadiae bacterium]|nr:metallophosphoesterase family protein [Candidatus Brocadiia bacterium]
MKKIAIISDIHANWEALNVVLDDIKQRNVDIIYCLGDVIGYGPSPTECLERTIQVCDFILMGNHEEAVLSGAFGFNPSAKQAVDWTRSKLKPGFFSSSRKKFRWEVLKNLPLCFTEGERLFVHASPRDPTMDYVLKSDTEDVFGEIPEKIREIFDQIDKVCFVGHTHMPGIITEDSQWFSPDEFDMVWEHKNGEKVICNVGSVGQPRDRDNRACYVTFTEKEIFYHRLPYDFKKTQEKIHKIPQLDNRNAKRLEFGT